MKLFEMCVKTIFLNNRYYDDVFCDPLKISFIRLHLSFPLHIPKNIWNFLKIGNKMTNYLESLKINLEPERDIQSDFVEILTFI